MGPRARGDRRHEKNLAERTPPVKSGFRWRAPSHGAPRRVSRAGVPSMALSPLASESAFVRGSVQKADGSELIGALVPLLRSTLRRRGLAAADVDDALQ